MTTLDRTINVLPSIPAPFVAASDPVVENHVVEDEWVFEGWKPKWPGTSFYVAQFNNAADGVRYEYARGYLAMVCMGGADFAPFSLKQGQDALDSYPGQKGDPGYSMF